MDEIRFNSPMQNAPMEETKPKVAFAGRFSVLKKILKVLFIVVILGVVAFLGFWGKDKLGGVFNKNQTYSAVFLSNGQVYFGKMTKNNEKEIVLNNVFYIQVNEKTTPEKQVNALGQTSFNLVKLGNELHGPTDELFINRLQVVFYEKLRDDSKVVEAIKNYK